MLEHSFSRLFVPCNFRPRDRSSRELSFPRTSKPCRVQTFPSADHSISKFLDPLITFERIEARAIRFKFGADIQDGPLLRVDRSWGLNRDHRGLNTIVSCLSSRSPGKGLQGLFVLGNESFNWTNSLENECSWLPNNHFKGTLWNFTNIV